jgi:hypothetical protein
MADPVSTSASSPTSALRPENEFDLPVFPADMPLRPENEFDFDALLAHAEEWRALAVSSPEWDRRRLGKSSERFVM